MVMSQDEIKMWNQTKGERKWAKCNYCNGLFPSENDRLAHEKEWHNR